MAGAPGLRARRRGNGGPPNKGTQAGGPLAASGGFSSSPGTIRTKFGRPIPNRQPWLLLRIAFVMFVASIPFEGITLGPLSLPRLIGFGFLALTFLQPEVCFRRPPAAFWCFVVFLVVFALRGWMTGFEATDSLQYRTFLLAQLYFVLWVGSNLFRYPRLFDQAINCFLLACVALSLLQLAGVTAGEAGQGRESAFNEDPNNIGAVLSVGLVAAVGSGYGRKGGSTLAKASAIMVFGVISLAVIRTASRGALVALATGIGVLVIREGSAWIRFRNLMIVAAGLVVLVVLSCVL